jgi:hypothetical protein
MCSSNYGGCDPEENQYDLKCSSNCYAFYNWEYPLVV